MKNIAIIISILSFFNITYAQVPVIQWQNTIGGYQSDVISSIKETLDGGYILSGYSNSSIGRDKSSFYIGTFDFWVVKINSIGLIMWQKSFGGTLFNDNPIVRQNLDGTYIVAGTSNSGISGNKTVNTNGGDDVWILKLDNSGNILWQKSIGGSNYDALSSIEIESNGNILMAVTSISSISGDKTEINYGLYDYWVLELNNQCEILWQKTIGGSANDFVNSICKTFDDGYIISGYSYSQISGNKTIDTYGESDYWIIKLDQNKNIIWQKSYGGDSTENNTSLYPTPQGDFVVGGSSNSLISGNKTVNNNGNFDYWVLKLDFAGTIIWQKSFGGSLSDDFASIDRTQEGNFILGGNSLSSISGDKTELNRGVDDIWIVKIDENGTILWDKTIGGNEHDYLKKDNIISTSDNGLIIGANSLSGISGEKTEIATGQDYWIIKLSPDNLSNNTLDSSTFSIYPNPTSGIFNIKFNSTFENYTITIRNYLGQIVKQENISTTNIYTNSIETQSGFYFIELKNKSNQKITFKIIKI
ncbi:T9SS type A sorting domain-containing protein [Flavobacterium sp. SUN052]|uniref:T9SS type A sorting domain-containing protein n=1 Tax=Flavobacterium sp. SUN052 TaxID=3002441 RepID=UPI00237E6F80|nr:T9SS type A sorting domain-containing protein [Flavobacterium sp. SUN052]MEC4005452.1 T9SS type A sorting domain-containing protein [Flavobacterium sp. SUN052]